MGRYDTQWRRYRRLQMLSLLVVVPFAAGFLLVEFPDSPAVRIPVSIAIVFGFIGVGSWFLLNYFRCPRCGKLFAINWWYNLSIFARKCVHCGLRKFTQED